MDKWQWEKAREILPTLRSLPPQDRMQYVEKVCAGDEDLRRAIESLLSADLERVSFLEAPPLRLLDSATPIEGRQFGAYRLVRELGQGGMGTVYLAARADEAFEGQVAIKILRPGGSIREFEWRFRQEIQILADLSHPNIAKLFEVGRTEDGIPYFIMEYIEGLPITRFCNVRGLTLVERLRLFQKVCNAVQYAHQNLIVHRDLKPSNILVTPEGEPKLLDFGIAKLLQPPASSEPATITELRFFTPDYASPEQVSSKHITTASDVYSLGVLLYEILSGHRPYDLKGRSESEIRQVICEKEPESPSVAVIRRKVTPLEGISKRSRQLRGDLDTIVLMALRKKPERRYNSPERLSNDIWRHLNGLPVRAQRDTLRYRAGKFLRRNALSLSISALLFSLIMIATLFIWQQRQRALRERDRAQRVADLLVEVLKTVDPTSESMNASYVLDRSTQTIRMELTDQPELKALFLQTLGDVYISWGNYYQAASLLNEALEIRRKILSLETPEIAETLYSLGVVAYRKGQFEQAEVLLQDSLRIRTKTLGDNAPELADNLMALGLLYKDQGDFSHTEQIYLEALEIRRNALGSESPEVGMLLHNIGAFYLDKGNFQGAEKAEDEALRILKGHFGPNHPNVALVVNGIGRLRKAQGSFDDAEKFYREALVIRRKVWGSPHPDVAASLNNLGLFLVSRNRPQEAESLLVESLAMQKRLKGEHHSDVAAALNNLAMCEEQQGKLPIALGHYRLALSIWKEKYHGPHQFVSSAYNNIGNLIMDFGQYEEAEDAFRAALEIDRELYGDDHPDVARKMSNLGRLLVEMGDYREAESLLQKSLSIRQKKFGEDHPDVAITLHNLAHLRWKQKKLQDAEQLFRRALAIKTKSSSPSSLARTQVDLAELLVSEDRLDEAEPIIRSAVNTFHAKLSPGDWQRAQAESVLGDVLGRQGHSEQAVILLSGSHRRLQELLGAQAPVTGSAHNRLKRFCEDGRVAEFSSCRALR